MAIPNVKRFRPFCTTCNENFTVMAVIPRDTDIDKYLADAVTRHDHKAFQEAKALQADGVDVSPRGLPRFGDRVDRHIEQGALLQTRHGALYAVMNA